jgi:hypothetical protein
MIFIQNYGDYFPIKNRNSSQLFFYFVIIITMSLMNDLRNTYGDITSAIDPPVNNLLWLFDGNNCQQNQYACIGSTLLKIFLILYASLVAPQLPEFMLKWFTLVPFKIFFLFLIAWSASHDPSLSILLAIAFYVSLNVVNGKQLFEQLTTNQKKNHKNGHY